VKPCEENAMTGLDHEKRAEGKARLGDTQRVHIDIAYGTETASLPAILDTQQNNNLAEMHTAGPESQIQRTVLLWRWCSLSTRAASQAVARSCATLQPPLPTHCQEVSRCREQARFRRPQSHILRALPLQFC
jgi:hypothetical protein